MVVIASPWWENFVVGIKVILRRVHVELVLKSSMEKRVGRTLPQIGKSNILESVGSVPEEDSLLGVLDVLRPILPGQDFDP